MNCAFPGDKASKYISEQRIDVQDLQSGPLNLKSSQIFNSTKNMESLQRGCRDLILEVKASKISFQS